MSATTKKTTEALDIEAVMIATSCTETEAKKALEISSGSITSAIILIYKAKEMVRDENINSTILDELSKVAILFMAQLKENRNDVKKLRELMKKGDQAPPPSPP